MLYPADQITATWEVNDVSPFKKRACTLGKTLGTNQDLNLLVHFNVYVDSTLQPQIQKHVWKELMLFLYLVLPV
jgi:hypothetical protein